MRVGREGLSESLRVKGEKEPVLTRAKGGAGQLCKRRQALGPHHLGLNTGPSNN